MWELDHKEGWVLKNWCFCTVAGEDSKVPWTRRDQTSQSSRKSTLIFIGWAAAKTEAPVLWPPDVKNWLTGKDPDAWKDWGQEERRTAEDEMAGWNHWLNGHELEKTPGDSEEQGNLACCSPWSGKESDTILATEQQGWNFSFARWKILGDWVYKFESTKHSWTVYHIVSYLLIILHCPKNPVFHLLISSLPPS